MARPLGARFWSKVSKDADGCWRWTGATNKSGYALFAINRKCRLAHRLTFVRAVGPIPAGLEIDHLCRTRNCVNPDHLEPVTRKENIRRSTVAEVARSRWANYTHCKHGHEFTPENTIRDNKGNGYRTRKCRACTNDRQRRARVRQEQHG